MKELLIDTANQTLSIALASNHQCVAQYQAQGQKNHAKTLMPIIDVMMKENAWFPKQLEQITVAIGPGSYTGVRIGVTTAKTLARTLDIPLKTVSSLASLAMGAPIGHDVVALFDARRDHVFAGVYRHDDKGLHVLREDQYMSIEELKQYIASFSSIIGVGDIDHFDFSDTTLKVAYHGDQCIPAAYRMTLCPGDYYEGADIDMVTPCYLKHVEAEEKWQAAHEICNDEATSYIKITNNTTL